MAELARKEGLIPLAVKLLSPRLFWKQREQRGLRDEHTEGKAYIVSVADEIGSALAIIHSNSKQSDVFLPLRNVKESHYLQTAQGRALQLVIQSNERTISPLPLHQSEVVLLWSPDVQAIDKLKELC